MDANEIRNEILNHQQFYGIPVHYEDIYQPMVVGKISKMDDNTIREYIEIIKRINEEKGYDLQCFSNDDFIVNMINNIDFSEIEKYMLNTKEYQMNQECDKNYVLCFRRAIPSEEPKTENFWSTSFSEVAQGLRFEINSDQRLHSVINVSVLSSLEKHGIVITNKGVSDEEIAINPNKSFSDFLFRYKPVSEIFSLMEFLEKGGKTRKEVLSELKKNRIEIMKKQGLPVETDELSEMIDEVNEDNYEEVLITNNWK